jgi:predicted transcriptional regulator
MAISSAYISTSVHRNLFSQCLDQGFYSLTNIMTKKQVGEERIYSAYTSILLFITKEVRTGTQAEQKSGADEEAMEGCSLLACLPWLAQPALL